MGAKRNSVWPTYPYHVAVMGDGTYQAYHLETGDTGEPRASYQEAETDAFARRAALLGGIEPGLGS